LTGAGTPETVSGLAVLTATPNAFDACNRYEAESAGCRLANVKWCSSHPEYP
jgi:hypothetical protein